MRLAASVLAFIVAGSLSSAAGAAVLTLGGGMGRACYVAAKGLRGSSAPISAVDLCTKALSGEAMPQRDRAATYVNRGILFMSRKEYRQAVKDHQSAIAMRPALAEAHVNLGAALIALGEPSEGVAALDQGLKLNTSEPEKAYYNRALGREIMGDLRGAYQDLNRAVELRPGWADPRRELARYSTRKADG